MKKLIIAVALLLTGRAYAEYIPRGCYVAFSNPSQCWEALDSHTQWTSYNDRTEGAYYYGYTMEAVIADGRDMRAVIAKCNNDYNTLVSTTNSCNASLNNANANSSLHYSWYSQCYDSAKAASKKSDSLIKKLRKACGSKCKKIK